MNAISLSEAKENLEKLVAQIIADVEPTIITTESGENVVLLSLDQFNSWQETLCLLSTPANAEHLRRSISEAEAGYTTERDLIDS